MLVIVSMASLLFACADSGGPIVIPAGSDTGSTGDSGRSGDDAGSSDDGGTRGDTETTDTGGTGGDTGTTDTGGTGNDTGTTDTGGTGNDTGTTDTGGTGDTTPPRDTTPPPDTTDDTAPPFVCGGDVFFTGQVFTPDGDPDPLSPNGGIPTFEPYGAGYDAGLQAVLDAVPSTDGESAVVELHFADATVVATSYNNDTAMRAQTQFWLADGNAALAVFFFTDDVESHPPFPIKVGQRISGTVTTVANFRGMPQIQGIVDWALESEENAVYIREVDGVDLTPADANHLVRLTGTLSGIRSPDCGGATCFELDYGARAPIVFRTYSDFVNIGTCLTFVGPVRLFDGTPQLDTINFDWLWTYIAD